MSISTLIQCGNIIHDVFTGTVDIIFSFFINIIMFFFPRLNIPKADVDMGEFNSHYTCVFVHGLAGWGSYEFYNSIVPYWGFFGGDLTKYLKARGMDSRAASVAPNGSTWDRACELYAQLMGTRVDYGEEHSKRCHHARYGKDYSKCPLLDEWSSQKKINLIGHSFGGTTIRMLASLIAYGSKKEQETTDQREISPLFTGGKADWINSITTLATPHNGTTAFILGHNVEKNGGSLCEMAETKLMFFISGEKKDGRLFEDSALYELDIDGAKEVNTRIETVPGIYYFSFACSKCHADEQGKMTTDPYGIEPLFINSAMLSVKWTGSSPGGIVLDETWQENDGLVNTISAKAPFNAPQKQYLEGSVAEPGVWNVMPVYRGDHTSLQGGLLVHNNVRPFFVKHINMINSLK